MIWYSFSILWLYRRNFSGVGLLLGVVSGWKTKESGNQRGKLDIGVSIIGGGTAILMTAGLIGTGGWMIVIPCAIYGVAVGIYDW